MKSFRVRIPEFESQRFFSFLAYFFVLRENLNLSCFTRRFFLLFGACSIHLQTNLFHSTQSKHHTDAVQMQKIHNFFKQETGDRLTISLKQAKERTSTNVRGRQDTIERLMKQDQTKGEKPERSRTKESPTGRI